MFTRIKSSPTTKRKYLQVCKATYQDGRTSHKVVGSLGAIDDLLDSKELYKLVESLTKIVKEHDPAANLQDSLLPKIKELKRYQWGSTKLIQTLWKTFELDTFFNSQELKISFDLKSILLLLITDRFLNPRSKLKTFEKQSNYLGIQTSFNLQHVYRSLNVLAGLKSNLEKHLFDINRNLFNMKVDIVFFDATTLYFHSDESDDLRKFGFSKDCKFNDVQIVMGLLMDEEGRPIGFQIFPGNTFDGKTLLKALGDLKKTFQIKKLIIVGDRGMCSEGNLEAVKKAGYEYIVATSLKKLGEDLQKTVLNEQGYKIVEKGSKEDPEIFKYKEVQLNNERLVVSWSGFRARKDAHDRARLIDKAKEILDGKIKLKKPGKAKYVVMDQKTKYLDEAGIMEDAKWDGYYGIKTNVDKEVKTDEQIYEAYHQLWKIEECFRVLKSHLKIRPIFHWNQERIEGHLVLCFLTFVFERHVEIELRRNGINSSPEKIREAMTELQASLVEINQRQYLMRSVVSKLGKDILKTFKIKTPQEFTLLEEF